MAERYELSTRTRARETSRLRKEREREIECWVKKRGSFLDRTHTPNTTHSRERENENAADLGARSANQVRWGVGFANFQKNRCFGGYVNKLK